MVSAVLRSVRVGVSARAMSKSHVFDEEDVPIAPDRPTRRSPSPLNGNRIESSLNAPPEQEQSFDNEEHENESVGETSGPCSAVEEPPRYRESSDGASSSESSSESEYSYDGSENKRCDTSSGSERRAQRPPSSLPRKVSSEGEEDNDASLSVLVAARMRVVSASPRTGSPLRKNGKRMIGLTSSEKLHDGAPLSSLAMSPSRQPNALLRHALPSSPRDHVKIRRSSRFTGSTVSQDSSRDGHVRRSSRGIQKPDALTVSTFSPVKRRKRKRKHSGSKVYGEETVDDMDDWENYGRIARQDDAKALLKSMQPRDDSKEETTSDNSVEPVCLFTESPRVYGEETASLNAPLDSESKSLWAWLNDSERHSEFLAAKRRRLNDNVDVLSDYVGTVKSRSRHPLRQKLLGRYQNREDNRMLDCLEDDMQFSLAVFVWSDHDACHKVFEESKTLADRQKEEYDKEGDAWSRNHFGLSTLPGVLLETELELAWLAEESLYCLNCPSWDWNYITIHASPALQCLLGQEHPVLVRPIVSLEFRQARDVIRNALHGGYRRPHMLEIIQRHLQLLYLRKQEEKDSD